MFYVPLGQDPSDVMTLVVRAAGGGVPTALAADVRSVVRSVDPEQPVASMAPLASLVRESVAQPRFTATVLAFFGMATLFLAMLGVYGIVSHMVERRTREMGIRMALGAKRGDVRAMVVGQGMGLTALGLALGMAAAWPAVRLLRSVLFGVTPFEAGIVAGVVAVLAVSGTLACWLPARRATRVDPAISLRWD
jgi:ABC-type antimicrobial peptide transport system permease subunit